MASLKTCEFITSELCVCDLFWISKFNKDFAKVSDKKALAKLFEILIFEDNQACIPNARNDGSSDLSKHLDLKNQLLFDRNRIEDIHL